MKQRTFFTTLVLFLVFFNLGIFIVTSVMYRDTVNRAKDRSLDEHYFLVSALIKDFRAVESRGIDINNLVQSLLQPYSYLFGDKKTGLALYKDNQLVFSSKDADKILSHSLVPPDDGNRLITLRKENKKTYVIVSGNFPIPYDSYRLVYRYDTTDAIASWTKLKNILFFVGFILSFLMAFGLLLVLNVIFKPLQQISKTSRDIANGEYETRLPVLGNDELAEVAKNFNHMAEEIQRQMRELKDAAAKKQQFVDNFAHELRTPMTAIYGYAEYMQKAVISEDDRLSALTFIMSETRRLQKIASQLLEIANLQNNQIHCKEVKISTLFETVKKSLYHKLKEKEILLEFKSEVETVLGDVSLLQSLFVNLIDNAIMACEKRGHIVVNATLENGVKTISVADNGKGMSPETLSQITEPFYRGDNSRNRRDGGAGLGLAICKQIALSHGADLSFTSHPGKGTMAKVAFTSS